MKNREFLKGQVPWRASHPRAQPPVTFPVFIAYCSVAAALRWWNRKDARFIAILKIPDADGIKIYTQAAEVFLQRIATVPDHFIKVWDKEDFKGRLRAEREDQAVFFVPEYEDLGSEAYLFADIVADLGRPKREHIKAALLRSGLPATPGDIELLLSEPWARLSDAFPKHRPVRVGLERLKRRPPISKAPSAPEAMDLRQLHGLGPVFDWGMDLARDLADYKAGRISWSEVDSGVLVSGPPGTGKTLFAGALARTCDVPLVYGSAAKWQKAGYLNDFLKSMNDVFDEARKLAPAIVFIDEIDSFGDRAIEGHNKDYKVQMINGLLELLDGHQRRRGVVVIGATNHPDAIDPAIKRAGRLDKHYAIPLPDAAARLAILSQYSRIQLQGDDAARFTLATEGISGVDIAQIVRNAKRSARRRSSELLASDILSHLPHLYELSTDDQRAIAVHEAGHAVIAVALSYGELLSVSVKRHRIAGAGGNVGGALFALPTFMRRSRKHYLDEIVVLLGGIAAEEVVFGEFFDGSAGSLNSDLVQATKAATLIEAGLGMGQTLVVEEDHPDRLDYLRVTDPLLRSRVHDTMTREFQRARSLIADNRAALEEITDLLTHANSISGDEVREICKRHQRSSVSLAKVPMGRM
ncbi:AAA family ATPase [Ensifer aridi]|uniref:AAA family ATPase n=1 Tax=Ensifer aridi TaxID=1708715 RepID=UPI000A10BFF0|nr:AAA family ATPase [Ensifer aridi]